ncbi:hypothetical protein COLO4_12510 [Corchorus olitorius]|uniref:Uncharacterized protein n=1 Tax=Corchorus olitorius TaxID=93759 RepID=A0A1R3K0Z9_9ROSI|nr:hypothetical protein COLO4_12510 [Corchorus olitorius]
MTKFKAEITVKILIEQATDSDSRNANILIAREGSCASVNSYSILNEEIMTGEVEPAGRGAQPLINVTPSPAENKNNALCDMMGEEEQSHNDNPLNVTPGEKTNKLLSENLEISKALPTK